MRRACRPVFSQAMRVVPLPPKLSRTRSPLREQSRMASATRATTSHFARLDGTRRQNLGVLFTELAPAPCIFSGARRVMLRHHVIRRPDRTSFAIACRLNADLFHLNIVSRK